VRCLRLQQILRHDPMAMTMRYSHLSPKHLREEMVRIERAETPPDRAQDRRMNPRNW
jgi:hypothetical protein